MSGAVVAAGIAAATAIGTTAYTARQNRKAEKRQAAAAKTAAAKSQTQENDPVQQFQRRRRGTQGFDQNLAMLGPAAGTSGQVGGALLGQ